MTTGTAAVIGVDLGGTTCSAVLACPSGQVLAELHRPSAALSDPADVMLGVIAELRATAARRGLSVAAIAIGIPAFVDRDTGLVVGGWNLGWHGVDLRARLDAELSVPHVLENDVNLAALGEARVGAGRGATSFVTLSLGTGLGGAVVVDGRLLRGHHGAAGEFGFLVAARNQLRRPGTMAMESLVGGWAIAARARELAAGVDTEIRPEAADAAAVFAAAERGDPLAEHVLAEVVDHVAMTIIDIVAVLDPARVILDGSVGRALSPYLPQLTEAVADRKSVV